MADEQKQAAELPPKEATNPPTAVVEDDSDPDFDDLDDVLDQFSANAPTKSQPAPSQPTPTSGPGRPSEPPLPTGPKPDESEEDFIARLTAEMAKMISSMENDPASATQSPEDIAKMGKELEDFTNKMEAQGIQPEDLLKAILGEEEGNKMVNQAHEEAAKQEEVKKESSEKQPLTAFEDTIRRTMSRLETSDTEAKNATAQSSTKSEEDMLAEMLKALEANPGAIGDDSEGGLSKMFLDMMQQLTHKEMLYEPMKELHVQYPSWLESHKPPKLTQGEYERYQRQSQIVSDIVTKFEEPSFSDDDAQCREYVWEKMQQMQNEGAPPEELVKNPFPGTDFGGMPGLGDGDEGPEEGCPTQ